MDKFCSDHENIILLGDFNVELKKKNIYEFMSICNIRNLVKQKTCFKNPVNLSCTDLILINSCRNFQDSSVFETGLPDVHKLTATALIQYFPKLKPKVVNYKDYQDFCDREFRAEFENKIFKHGMDNMK